MRSEAGKAVGIWTRLALPRACSQLRAEGPRVLPWDLLSQPGKYQQDPTGRAQHTAKKAPSVIECVHRKVFDLRGRRPKVLTFTTTGCKPLSKHLLDT